MHVLQKRNALFVSLVLLASHVGDLLLVFDDDCFYCNLSYDENDQMNVLKGNDLSVFLFFAPVACAVVDDRTHDNMCRRRDDNLWSVSFDDDECTYSYYE